MRHKRWLGWIAVFLVGALLAACGGSPQPGAGDATEPGTDEGSTDGAAGVDWEIPAIDQLPDEVAAWVEQQQAQTGIFQLTHDDRTYILIAWGEKPTGGYEVVVDDVQPLGEDALRLDITLTAPGEDAIVTQVLTYPIALVAVEPGTYYRLEPHFEGARFLENNSFRIDEPAMFAEVGDSVRVTGEARVFEGVFQISVEDGHVVLAHQVIQVEGAPAWAPFDVTLEFEETPTSPNGVVFVYTHSPRDGSVMDAIGVPISFTTWE